MSNILIDSIKSVSSILKITLLIINNFFAGKKTIFFYHPKKELTLIHMDYLENFFYNNKKIRVFFGCQINIKRKNYYFIKQTYLNFLLGIDMFITNN